MLPDGIYGLNFNSGGFGSHGRAEDRGDGLAVLRGGRIVGSDPNGGVFKGRYRYDAERCEAVIDVRLAIPPNGVLLTGLRAGPEGAFLDVSGRFPPPAPVSSATVDVGGAPLTVELRYVGRLAG
jgi:hypothetical protein